jgi:glycosyltransferase involved in cell wall biosynthesis
VSLEVATRFCGSAESSQPINTTGWDFYLCQKGCPYRLAPGTRAIVRYHDAIPIFYPHTIVDPSAHMDTHHALVRAGLRDGAFFACTTEPVREDLLRLVPAAEASSAVIPDIVSPAFRPTPMSREGLAEIMAVREHLGAGPREPGRIRRLLADVALDRYVLAVSTLEPRKNFSLLLQGFLQAVRASSQPFRLVLVANPGWRSEETLEEIGRLAAGGSVVHLVKVPLPELRALYSNAHAVVCPSRKEGFDLSGVEAMLCDTPVVASDIPVHRWVYGDAARYFDTYDSASLARSLIEVVNAPKDAGLLAEIRARGRARAQLYTPQALAPKWEALFDRLLARRRDDGAVVPDAAAADLARAAAG